MCTEGSGLSKKVMKILIDGMGSIGQRHHAILSALYPAALIETVSRHCDTGRGSYKNIEDVPKLGSYDYYVICSETARHLQDFEAIEQVARNSRVLIEKPIFDRAVTFNTVHNIVFVGYNLRFHPVLQKLKIELASRKVLAAYIQAGQYLPTWRPDTDYRDSYSASQQRGGGVLLDMSHELDYAQWLFGNFTELRALDRKVSRLQIDSDDIMSMVGLTDQAILTSISIDYLSRIPVRRLVVHCEDATIFADLVAGSMDIGTDEGRECILSGLVVDRNETYSNMHKAILEGCSSDVCGLEGGIAVMQTIEMIRKSEKKDWQHE